MRRRLAAAAVAAGRYQILAAINAPNRAIAVAELDGPEVPLAAVDRLADTEQVNAANAPSWR